MISDTARKKKRCMLFALSKHEVSMLSTAEIYKIKSVLIEITNH